MLDDVYDYTKRYHKGAGKGFSRFGGSAGQLAAGSVYEFGISVWKMGSRVTPYLGM